MKEGKIGRGSGTPSAVSAMHRGTDSSLLWGPRTFFNRGFGSVGSLIRVGGAYVMQRSPGVIESLMLKAVIGFFPAGERNGFVSFNQLRNRYYSESAS